MRTVCAVRGVVNVEFNFAFEVVGGVSVFSLVVVGRLL